ncbi:hypothetical protein TGPRC2_208830 [Toxoplasma gondii TgCatPRC2]|uniref:Uncharacterized protein n=1 Tax=Toxoplasma gondii TgCatPRC2 TaxID=1130821 RepID=A0A151HGN8_TOXGO|nr:hypothetical protein TGPRC2_208830 [Toxoplasma gondii TgCatPRC2]
MYRNHSGIRLACRLFEVGALVLALENVSGIHRFVAGIEWNEGKEDFQYTTSPWVIPPDGLVSRRLAEEPPRKRLRKTNKSDRDSDSAQGSRTTSPGSLGGFGATGGRVAAPRIRSGVVASEAIRGTIWRRPGEVEGTLKLRRTRPQYSQTDGDGLQGKRLSSTGERSGISHGAQSLAMRPRTMGQTMKSLESSWDSDPLEGTSRDWQYVTTSETAASPGLTGFGRIGRKFAPLYVRDRKFDLLQFVNLTRSKKQKLLMSSKSPSLRKLLMNDMAQEWALGILQIALQGRQRALQASHTTRTTEPASGTDGTSKSSEDEATRASEGNASVNQTSPAASYPRRPSSDEGQDSGRRKCSKRSPSRLVQNAPLFLKDDSHSLKDTLDLVKNKNRELTEKGRVHATPLRVVLLNSIMMKKLEKVLPVVESMDRALMARQTSSEAATVDDSSTSISHGMQGSTTSGAAAVQGPSTSVPGASGGLGPSGGKRKPDDEDDFDCSRAKRKNDQM